MRYLCIQDIGIALRKLDKFNSVQRVKSNRKNQTCQVCVNKIDSYISNIQVNLMFCTNFYQGIDDTDTSARLKLDYSISYKHGVLFIVYSIYKGKSIRHTLLM